MNLDYKPKTPYKPVNESSNKYIAGLAGNVAQGKTGRESATPGSSTRNYNYTVNPTFAEPVQVKEVPPIQRNYQPVQQPQQSTAYQNINPSNFQLNPYNGSGATLPTTNYFQNPAPQNTIDPVKAIADSAEDVKPIAQMIINAYTQHLGRLPDENGYFAHLHRALQERDAGKAPTWQTVTDWIRDSEEGARYQTERDVALQVDPEKTALDQAYAQWMLQNQQSGRDAQLSYDQNYGKYALDYSNTLEDLARQVAASRIQSESDMNKRGLWHSGVLDKAYQTIDQNNALARGRIGSEYYRNTGNLTQDLQNALYKLGQNADLYGRQYGENTANLMRRREQLVSQALDKLLEQRQEEQRWQTEFDRRVLESDRDYALRLMAAQGGGGGGGGGGFSGSGAGGALTPAESDAITQLVLERTGRGMSAEDAIADVMGLVQLGRVPGVSMSGMSDWSYTNSDASGGYPGINAAANIQQAPVRNIVQPAIQKTVDFFTNW
jgi:hypothetical protein